ncbi:MAG: DoxX family protein [Tepidisphaeraceae bacterium]|jgi:hypothetical protein
MKSRKIVYWITTALTAFVFISGGVFDIARPDFVMKGMAHLGYPVYFVVILGVWKTLGGLVALAPRMPLVKEWAYAGMLFDLTGATASHASVGDPAIRIATPIIILCIVITSWALRPTSRRICGGSINPVI